MHELNLRYLEALRKLYNFIGLKSKPWDEKISLAEFSLTLNSRITNLQKPPLPLILPKLIVEEKIKIYEQKIVEIKEEAERTGITLPLEKICSEHQLSKDERLIILFLFFKRLEERKVSGVALVEMVASRNDGPLSKIRLLAPQGKLRTAGLLIEEDDRFDEKQLYFEKNFQITPKTFWAIAGLEELYEPDDIDQTSRRGRNVLLIKEPEVSFENLILTTEVKERIEEALWQYKNGQRVYEKYGLKDKISYGRAVAMLFYGPPGTGKTATSEAIAKHLGKKLGIANYAQIYDCYVGESEKNILKAFSEAKKNDCIFLFDEADSLFAQRVSGQNSSDRMANTMTNILMQQLEKFSGIIILTTNREVVIDKAFERRLLLKLKFNLPASEMRIKIWQFFLKDCPNLARDVFFEELGHFPLSGGKIKNAVIKTVMRCARAERTITLSDLIYSAEEELKTDLGKEKEIGFRT